MVEKAINGDLRLDTDGGDITAVGIYREGRNVEFYATNNPYGEGMAAKHARIHLVGLDLTPKGKGLKVTFVTRWREIKRRAYPLRHVCIFRQIPGTGSVIKLSPDIEFVI